MRNDIVPVIVTGSTPIVPLINPSLNINTISELIARARQSPELTYASGGTGSALHLAGELFQKAAASSSSIFHIRVSPRLLPTWCLEPST